ncbi:hypothetical protein SDC9_75983 [bioreactor metagenome]|uniref:Uncharacterized protein n=1 Tax=bioreactor metagenome TaxID=1076179 RepID=A0A644YSJ5_9ZZZZ
MDQVNILKKQNSDIFTISTISSIMVIVSGGNAPFRGAAPYDYNFNDVGYYFEVEFSLADIRTRPLD